MNTNKHLVGLLIIIERERYFLQLSLRRVSVWSKISYWICNLINQTLTLVELNWRKSFPLSIIIDNIALCQFVCCTERGSLNLDLVCLVLRLIFLLPFTAYMFIGLLTIAGFVPFGLLFTNPSTSLFVWPMCTLLMFVIKWFDLTSRAPK